MTPPTRGSGLLETLLARRRIAEALSLIPQSLQNGRFVDIGCGIPPMFLQTSRASQKTGVDLRVKEGAYESIRLLTHDAATHNPLPLANGCADVVTMLAMIEHLTLDRGKQLLEEAHRILAPAGMVILTTPAPFASPMLRLMSVFNLVSPQEINDHKQMYDRESLRDALNAAGFVDVRTGFFECGLNQWATGMKVDR